MRSLFTTFAYNGGMCGEGTAAPGLFARKRRRPFPGGRMTDNGKD